MQCYPHRSVQCVKVHIYRTNLSLSLLFILVINTQTWIFEIKSCLKKKKKKRNSRFHVEEVAHGHVGVALAVAVALSEQLVLGPGHVDPVRPGVGLVVYGGVRRRVPVVDELRLREAGEQGERNTTCCCFTDQERAETARES